MAPVASSSTLAQLSQFQRPGVEHGRVQFPAALTVGRTGEGAPPPHRSPFSRCPPLALPQQASRLSCSLEYPCLAVSPPPWPCALFLLSPKPSTDPTLAQPGQASAPVSAPVHVLIHFMSCGPSLRLCSIGLRAPCVSRYLQRTCHTDVHSHSRDARRHHGTRVHECRAPAGAQRLKHNVPPRQARRTPSLAHPSQHTTTHLRPLRTDPLATRHDRRGTGPERPS